MADISGVGNSGPSKGVKGFVSGENDKTPRPAATNLPKLDGFFAAADTANETTKQIETTIEKILNLSEKEKKAGLGEELRKEYYRLNPEKNPLTGDFRAKLEGALKEIESQIAQEEDRLLNMPQDDKNKGFLGAIHTEIQTLKTKSRLIKTFFNPPKIGEANETTKQIENTIDKILNLSEKEKKAGLGEELRKEYYRLNPEKNPLTGDFRAKLEGALEEIESQIAQEEDRLLNMPQDDKNKGFLGAIHTQIQTLEIKSGLIKTFFNPNKAAKP